MKQCSSWLVAYKQPVFKGMTSAMSSKICLCFFQSHCSQTLSRTMFANLLCRLFCTLLVISYGDAVFLVNLNSLLIICVFCNWFCILWKDLLLSQCNATINCYVC